MALTIVDSGGSFRLVTDGRHWAVVEARCGHVYSLHGQHRREAPDGEDGIAQVVGEDWLTETDARDCFANAVSGGNAYARIIW
ncbi:MAG: hypothetical protein ACM33T_05510 [Solirubrobacterales bacterium]